MQCTESDEFGLLNDDWGFETGGNSLIIEIRLMIGNHQSAFRIPKSYRAA